MKKLFNNIFLTKRHKLDDQKGLLLGLDEKVHPLNIKTSLLSLFVISLT